ncbi:hypothetical protein HJO_09209 [Hyphomonas johnsonii MHS-2]|uniref:Lipoprotein n=1 Tax=Hyphomonas johnsonii MHS-2 TaxID=1280950 RepID=A0A059FNK4_9PROT|nr:hypothetical protein HJO_09209 [Hyphomonas johnsonii MHS-2]
MMRNVTISIVLIGLTGCASTEQAKSQVEPEVQIASQEEIDGATQGVLNCARAAIHLYDDKVSPADTVGRAISGHCRQEITTLIAASTKGMDRYTRSGFLEAFDAEEIFTSLVLQARARR